MKSEPKCELCGNDISFEPVIPVVQHVYAGLEPLPTTCGYIHLQCLREVVDSVRQIGLTISQPSHSLGSAPSTSAPEEAHHGTTSHGE